LIGGILKLETQLNAKLEDPPPGEPLGSVS
jgi:hypothetical protein